jgi:diadenosine tetraphosphate (Ap4A) HIT family hydrolase
LQKADLTIDGFNNGMNCGETAGQSVFHCHVHLIPGRRGDLARQYLALEQAIQDIDRPQLGRELTDWSPDSGHSAASVQRYR